MSSVLKRGPWRRVGRKTVFHGVENSCDCLRTELPLECQAQSSGALGTPERDHDCPDCNGCGLAQFPSILSCTRCAGTGELTFRGEPALPRSDSATRSQLSAARAAGRIGRRG